MLQDRTAEAFARAVTALEGSSSPGVVRAAEALERAQTQLQNPMAIALVGRVSSGKSTLANALLGSELVATGIQELTFNVNVVRHADAPSLMLHFKDGRAPEARALGELEKVTARAQEHHDLLRSIDWVEVFYPNERLRLFDLVDTPGLDSALGEDSANTLRFLGRTALDIRTDTLARAASADALLLVFSRSLGGADEDVLADFSRGLRAATPINAIAVLTKVEHYWPGEPDPMAAGRRVAARLMDDHRVRQLLFGVQPVASLVGAGAETLTPEVFEDLALLAKAPPDLLEQRVRRASFFCQRDYPDLVVTADRRNELFQRFGGWGICLSCRLIRDGVDGPEALREQLVRASGLADLRDLIAAHFGNRAFLIKLQRALAEAKSLPRTLRNDLDDHDGAAVLRAVGELERLELNEPAFEELAVLRSHYDGQLELTAEEVEELLLLTGERGVWVTDRLGLERTASVDQMYTAAQQRLRYWSHKDTDPGVMGPTREATRTVRRSYERLVHHIRQARRHLELIQ